ncbi:hypothetical protein M3210_17570 [Oceanobacillus luteolus]|uniref:accessory Sec system protein Asp2 n=1 Tax=Oceanobacillus luteolus TaxID=1274358 RepID=UPI002041BA80|nr:accessory Sec system protein Asp2 [Oceanobacillus luteolus]MCM3742050.1 hypothetical protein [Oceanobacillus luteolus]
MNFTESVYEGTTREVKYVLEEAEHNTDYLVIVFSGFASVKAASPYRYNYIRTLRQVDAHKLFILDEDGPRGSYYLGKAMSFDFEKSIIELIEETMNKLGVEHKNVITAGTSKGGSAALYYALKYKLGRAIVGAPQTKIANYVLSINGETADYMLGDRTDKEKVIKLNRLIYDQLEHNQETILTILGSEHDNQHKQHIAPFAEELKERNHPHTLILDDDIKGHNDVAVYYPPFIVNELLDIMYGLKVTDVNYEADYEGFKVQTETVIPEGYTEVIRFYDGDTLINEIGYNDTRNTFKLDLEKITFVTISYAILKESNVIYRKDLAEHLISDKNIICEPVIEKVNDRKFKFDLNLQTNQNLQYAFYVYQNGKVIEKIMYQRKQTMTYRAKEEGKYLVKYFILLPTKEKVIGKSDVILI